MPSTPVQHVADIREIRLPDSFYLPRTTWSGTEVRDVVPWDGATDYVTDGDRYGVRFQDSRIVWFEESREDRFREDFEGIDLDQLVAGLRKYVRQNHMLKSIWREDIETLERLRSAHDPPKEDTA